MSSEHLVSWSTLLAHWMDFARSALALPASGEGARLRAAVPAIIALQATTHALAELGSLPEGEYAVGQDRAEVLIRRHAAEIHRLWSGEQLPEGLREIIDDARAVLKATREGGLEWRAGADRLVLEHPAELVVALTALGFSGDLYAGAPGVPLFKGCPAAFAREASGASPGEQVVGLIGAFLGEVAAPQRVPMFRQAYRQFDFGAGRAVRDLVVSSADLPGGQPLLVPVVLRGEAQAVALPMRQTRSQEALPVVMEGSEERREAGRSEG